MFKTLPAVVTTFAAMLILAPRLVAVVFTTEFVFVTVPSIVMVTFPVDLFPLPSYMIPEMVESL
ncbi:hypothetical protein JEQ21_01050 [Streptococcus sp. 121]|uniref:hypothetical protein n=1 Tax=Streptococcus sp. 121 TaxID=2797637 RepID=UPI0018F0C797|nr:hypothetical protein [Streptococcus sp. 121]MBJ6745056.1 hypothetical protein [Streptococcus sp. 121]